MSQPPRELRWSEQADLELPGELAELLRAGRAPLGTPDEVAELSRRLSAALGPASGLPSAGQPPAPSGSVSGGQGGALALGAARRGLSTYGAVGAAIALGVASWLTLRGPVEHPVEAMRVAESVAAGSGENTLTGPAAAPGTGAVSPALPALDAATAEEPRPGADAADRRSDVTSGPPPRAKARAVAPSRGRGDGLSETTLLEQARAALQSRPALALELARRHRARFGEGALAEEREVIAIKALERLGRREAARARAAEFERRYRGSVHRPRLLRGTDTSGPAGGALNTAPP